jgi:hypothetical protein
VGDIAAKAIGLVPTGCDKEGLLVLELGVELTSPVALDDRGSRRLFRCQAIIFGQLSLDQKKRGKKEKW